MSKLKNPCLAHQQDQDQACAQPQPLRRGSKNMKEPRLTPAKCVGKLLKEKAF